MAEIPRYTIVLKSIGGEEFSDVISCICVRAPFYKKASFWMIKVNVGSLWAEHMYNDIGRPTTPQLELFIYSVKHEGETNNDERSKLVHHKLYRCVSVTNGMGGLKLNLTDVNTEVILTLVDHVLYDLSIKNNYNKKLNNKTAFEVLTNYESEIKDRYGENAFWSNHIGIDNVKNEYKYEELLLTSNNDLQVSDILLYSKKALKDVAFYFFDDFCLDDKCSGLIARHLINLNAKNSNFKKFDVTKYFDTVFTSSIIKEIPYSDTFRLLTQGYDSFIFKTKYMFNKIDVLEKEVLYQPIISSVTKNSDYKINNNRKTSVIEPTINFQKTNDSKRQKSMIIYVPDNKKEAVDRLKRYKTFVENRVKQLSYIQTTNCFCDWLQFGRLYNLNINNPQEYLYTPITITNMFYKEGNERTVRHTSKAKIGRASCRERG